MPLSAWVSKRLDFTLGDWLFALRACATSGGVAAERIERRWSPEGEGVVGLSVRSLFDLYLRASGWAPGDRVVFTALTVGDMPAIARAHGLEVASVDIDPDTTEPDPAALAAALTPRTRALVFTHLYGARLDVSAALALASSSAQAPSFTPDALPAVTEPCACTMGLSLASASKDVLRGCSSRVTSKASPFFWGMVTGQISESK